jgi:hypothetical protein
MTRKITQEMKDKCLKLLECDEFVKSYKGNKDLQAIMVCNELVKRGEWKDSFKECESSFDISMEKCCDLIRHTLNAKDKFKKADVHGMNFDPTLSHLIKAQDLLLKAFLEIHKGHRKVSIACYRSWEGDPNAKVGTSEGVEYTDQDIGIVLRGGAGGGK